MRWTKPDFQEITLNMEVTGYVNTDDDVDTVGQVANLPSPAEKAGWQPAPQEIQS